MVGYEDIEFGTVYTGASFPYVVVRNGEYVIEGVGPYVKSGIEERVLKALERGGIAYFAEGAGVGKSAAALVALYEYLKGRDAAVVAVDLSVPISPQRLTRGLRDLKQAGATPLFYVDASPIERYLYGEVALPHISQVAVNLKKIAPLMAEYNTLLVVDKFVENNVDLEEVLPPDRVEVVDPYIEGEERVYASIVEKYSGCPADVAEKVARSILGTFSDYYAVAAVKAAERLRNVGCDADVADVVDVARRDVLRRVCNHILYAGYGGKADAEAARDLLISAYSILYNMREFGDFEPISTDKEVVVKIVEDAVAPGNVIMCSITRCCTLAYAVREELIRAGIPLGGDVYEIVRNYIEKMYPHLLLD